MAQFGDEGSHAHACDGDDGEDEGQAEVVEVVHMAILADLGLTAPQAAVLRLVAGQPGSGVRHLARMLGTDPMNTQRIAEILITGGLCEPRHDPRDGRRRPLHPTEKGRALADEVARRAQREEERLLAMLGRRQHHALIDGLGCLVSDAASKAAE